MSFHRICASWSIALLLPLSLAGQNTPKATQASATAASAAVVSPTCISAAEIERMRSQLQDWPNLARYRDADAALPAPARGEQRVVFLGDSITDRWGRKVGDFFPGKPYINRGISGQTTPQMLIRFQQDVVSLHPVAVVLLGGTNDIARNTGPTTPEMIEDNIASMAAVAKQNGIKLIIASILPAARYHWRPEIKGAEEIRQVNQWLKTFCVEHGLVYLDYYSAMADNVGGMRPGLSSDEVHPTEKGYAIMAPLAVAAIREAFSRQPGAHLHAGK
jgi:acyl-CoA thioesterase I